ncbi:MAG TPA: NUDIX hydrolase [Desulfomonilaceae bacterium]|nr:NUDIX hydrolase [Desulfomonilaceae bacterium]
MSREYPRFPLVGVGALITRDDRVVLVRRGTQPAKGEWSIPGGLVNVGETLKDAVVREALEETGLEVEPVELLELVERIFHDDDGRVQYHYVIADFVCKVRGGNIAAGSDALEAVWIHRDQLRQLNLAAVTLEVILKGLGSGRE